MILARWALFAVGSAGFAQVTAASGALSGTILDDFGEPVSNAAVAAANSAGREFKVTSSARGEYSIGGLPEGDYSVAVTALAMQPYKSSVAVRASQMVHLDVTLRPAGNTLGTLGEGDRFSAAFYSSLPKKAAPEGPTPRLPEGTPDLSGYWTGGQTSPGEPIQPRPWAAAIRNERQANNQRDLPEARCLPTGVVRGAGRGKFVETANLLVVLPGGDPPRLIFLDGRGHPQELNPTWLGHSIGHWEGDTLVVDTVGFNGLAWVNGGIPSTEMLHVIERYRRPDLGHLELEMTVDDPAVLQKPWTSRQVSVLDPAGEVEEYICSENNRDVQHLVGK
jgi:hypothetical protein